jgi:hypothetical protein
MSTTMTREVFFHTTHAEKSAVGATCIYQQISSSLLSSDFAEILRDDLGPGTENFLYLA